MTRVLSLRDIVAALGGDLHHGGRHANVPAPGHSKADRSVSLLLDGDRLVIHGFGSADWRDVRTHLQSLGLIDAGGRMTGATAAASGAGRSAPPRPPPRVRIATAQALWANALPLAEGDLCYRYFQLRGVRLRSTPDNLRRQPAAPVSVFRQTGLTCPALVAAIRTPEDAISAVEIAYLDPDGRAARRLRLPRKTVGSAPGGVAVRLSSPGIEMLVGEGVATTLSAMARFDLSGWALLSAGNLARWSPPAGVRSVLIAGDRGRAGEAAAAELCARLRGEGTAAQVRLPPAPFGDWNEAEAGRREEEEEEGRGGRRQGGDRPRRTGGRRPMTRSASRVAAAPAPATRTLASARSAPTRSQAVVRLGDLDIAPENLRHGEAPDDDIPQLADTIAAAGLLQFPTVRPGRSGEAAFMVLDGRRRLLALWLLRDGGFIDDNHPVEVFVETDRARQAAAVVLTNTAVPVHVADVVAAIGRMLKARLGVKAIARALGYGEIEIRRLAALSALPAVALEALKSGRITLRQARLLARLKDADTQAELAQAVLDGHSLQEWRIQEQLGEGRITNRDPRCGLVTPDLFAAEGGRTEVDLFGELPSVLLDPEALTRAWLKRAADVAAPLEAEGLTVHLAPGDDGPDMPEDLEQLYYAYGGLSDEATLVYREARDRAQAAAEAVAAMEPETAGDDRAEALEAFVRTRIAQDQAGAGQRLATVLVVRPSLRTGVEIDSYGPVEAEVERVRSADDEADDVDTATEPAGRPVARSAYAPPRADAPSPEVEGVSHVLHATRTDMGTRGLIRALADEPEVALTALVARLFGSMTVWPPVGRTEAVLAITAATFNPSGGRIVEGLDGAVRERLDERRRAWEASGLTMIAWVHAMDMGDRLGLLAELTALSLDLREDRTSLVRKTARTEAAEIADLCDADISRWWTPDGAYLRPHSREQLLTMLERMGAETDAAARLRKGDLVAWTEDQAQARKWAPACLSWSLVPDDAADAPDADALDADTDGRRGQGDVSGDGADDGGQGTDGEAAWGVGVFVVTPSGEAALVGAGPIDAVVDDAAA